MAVLAVHITTTVQPVDLEAEEQSGPQDSEVQEEEVVIPEEVEARPTRMSSRK